MTRPAGSSSSRDIVEQLAQLLEQRNAGAVPSVPPPFEPLEGEPDPWSEPPPGGFEALRETLRRGSNGQPKDHTEED